MRDIKNERNLKNAIDAGHKMATTPHRELLGNLEEWCEHFRENQHGATLTLLRAKSAISDLERLLNDAYVFLGTRHKNLEPWRVAIDDWQARVEEQTGWSHFAESQEFNARSVTND